MKTPTPHLQVSIIEDSIIYDRILEALLSIACGGLGAGAPAAREAVGHVRQPRFHTRLRAEMGARIAAEKKLAAAGGR
jgi:hypothetical protein